MQPELADDFLGFGQDFLLPDKAFQIGLVVLFDDEFFDRRYGLFIEVCGAGELGEQPGEKVGDGHRISGKRALSAGPFRAKFPSHPLSGYSCLERAGRTCSDGFGSSGNFPVD